MPTEKLLIRVDEKGAIVASRNIESVGTSAKATGGALQLLKRALVALAGALIIRQLVGMADAFTVIQNKLKIVTTGTENLNQVTNELFDIATKTRSSFEETAASYAKFALAANQLGREQSEVLRFTELINKAVVIGGASAMEAAGGLRQLSQGLASGALRGDELRSVLENLPFVADTIARSIGITRGELRNLGLQGKITAELVLDAFKDQADYLDSEYKKTNLTVGQSITLLQNSFLKLIGEFDKSKGITGAMALRIAALGDSIGTLATIAKTLGVVLAITFSQQLIGQAAILMTNLSNAIMATSKSMTLLATGAIPALSKAVRGLGVAFKSLWQAIIANPLIAVGAVAIGGLIAAMDVLNRKMDEAEAAQDRAHQRALGMIRAKLKEMQAVEKANKVIEAAIVALKLENELLRLNETERAIRVAIMKAEKGAGRELNDIEAQTVRNLVLERHAVEANNDALQEMKDILESIKGPQQDFDRRLQILDTLLKKKAINVLEYDRAVAGLKATLESAMKDPEIKQTKRDPVAETLASLERENELLKMNNQERMIQSELDRVRNELAKENKDLNEADETRIRALMLLNDEQARQNQLLQDIQGPQEMYELNVRSLNTLLSDGKINMEQYNSKLEELKDRLGSISQQDGGHAEEILSSVFDNGINALNDMDRSWKKFVAGFLADLARMAQQQIMFNLIKSFGSFGGGGGGGGGGDGSSAVSQIGMARGGEFMVGGSGGTDSQGITFNATPGERVRVETPAQQRMSSVPTIATPVVNLKIVNVVDMAMIKEYMAGDEGEEVVLNHINNNGPTVRQTIS